MFPGKVTDVQRGAVAAVVKVEVTQPGIFTAMITKDAVDDLKLKKGDSVYIMVKSTEVMVVKE